MQHMCMQVAPLAAAFVGYVVFWNLSLQVNSVGFYQLSKIMVLPTVAALEVNPMHCTLVPLRLDLCRIFALGAILVSDMCAHHRVASTQGGSRGGHQGQNCSHLWDSYLWHMSTPLHKAYWGRKALQLWCQSRRMHAMSDMKPQVLDMLQLCAEDRRVHAVPGDEAAADEDGVRCNCAGGGEEWSWQR